MAKDKESKVDPMLYTSRKDNEDEQKVFIDNYDSDQVKDNHLEKQMANKDEVRNRLTILATYPHVLERPFCEAIIKGEKQIIKVLSKRGERVKVIEAGTIKTYLINDFESITVL